MKYFLLLIVFLLVLGCADLPQTVKDQDMVAFVFGGVGEYVKITSDGNPVFDGRIPEPNEFGFSLKLKLPRPGGKMQLVIERRGTRKILFVDANRVANIYLLLGISGGAEILDADKVPPLSD